VTTALVRPIFVVGCPRSGTTLVQCILSASSQAFSLPETHFFSYVLPEMGRLPDDPLEASDLARARALLEAEADLPDLGNFWAALAERLGQTAPPLTALDVFVALVEHFRPPDGASQRAIEKTPLHVLCLEWIGACFPDAVVVNVVRDPIDVTSSLLGVPWQSSRSVIAHAARWMESVGAAEAYAAAHPERLVTVVYERLVREPEAEVRRLCAFVGLDYEPAMLDEFGQQAARNVGRGETWKRDVGSGVLLNRAGVWRSRMTPGQAWLVARATADRAGAYGYAVPPGVGRPSIAQAALQEARVRFAEARPNSGLVGAARHAGSVLKAFGAA